MTLLLILVGSLTFLVVLAGALEMMWGNRTISFLKEVPIASTLSWPAVSIVIPARNEEDHIAAALESVLQLDYEPLEVLVINDRSTDRTGEILASLALRYPRLKPLSVTDLPAGWIGKNHALAYGASQATGEWLLFADADIVMETSALRRAVSFAVAHQRDHIAVIPALSLQGFWLNLFASCFTMFFSAYYKPWKVKDPASPCFIGIGAFNLMRKSVYQAIGGHERIAFRPDDDLMLGKLIKRQGYAQDLLFGRGMLSVEWYASTGQMVQGLMKNAFSGVNYSVFLVIFFTAVAWLVYLWPFMALGVTHGMVWGLNAGIVATELILFWDTGRFLGHRPGFAFGVPLGALFLIYILWRAMVLNLKEGGIRWRGTFYALDRLKENKV